MFTIIFFYISAQESASVQILLEAGLSEAENNVKEVKLICAYLHETYINDPNLAKLVHFQVKIFYLFSVQCSVEKRVIIFVEK